MVQHITTVERASKIALPLSNEPWTMVHSRDSVHLIKVKTSNIVLEKCSPNKKGVHLPFYHCTTKNNSSIPLDYEVMNLLVKTHEIFAFLTKELLTTQNEITILCTGTTFISPDRSQEGISYLSYKKGAPEVQVGILPKFKCCNLKNVYRLTYKETA